MSGVGAPGAGFGFPVPIITQATPLSQTVNYYRFVGGVKGDMPDHWTLKNWTYDVYGQFSRSDGSYTQSYQKADRVSATAGSDTASGCDTSSTWVSNESMDQLEPGVACVPVNYFAAVQNGHFTPAEYKPASFKAAIKGSTARVSLMSPNAATAICRTLASGSFMAAIRAVTAGAPISTMNVPRLS